ncbi:hypothetical protein C8R48DRAFT_794787 [Suillus tomentosus]|nr:hypothetical protein C8R48DRAFT_794787 [Suillus tomentosus]
MYRSTSYNFWQQDSELYLHVKASSAEHLQTTTGHSTSQPHQDFSHPVLENIAYDPTPVVSQHHVACDGDSTTEDHTVVPRDDVPDAGLSPILIAQGDIQSVPSSYLPVYNMGFSDVNLANPWPPAQGFQHDPPHQSQEEVDPHPPYVVNDDESKSHVDHRSSVCQWNDGHGACGKTISAANTTNHVKSYHFKPHSPPAERLKCLWKDCELHKSVRRDTIIRHIKEKHLGHKYRSKLGLAFRTRADSRGSRKNTHLH